MIKRDFTQHNEEAKAVWEAYLAGHPIRVPVILGTSARYYLYDEAINPKGKDHIPGLLRRSSGDDGCSAARRRRADV